MQAARDVADGRPSDLSAPIAGLDYCRVPLEAVDRLEADPMLLDVDLVLRIVPFIFNSLIIATI